MKHRSPIEEVWRRATKLVPQIKQLKFEERLKPFKLPSMCFRRARDMIEQYKYTHDLYKMTNVLLAADPNNTRRGHEYKLKKAALQHCINAKLRTSIRGSLIHGTLTSTCDTIPKLK